MIPRSIRTSCLVGLASLALFGCASDRRLIVTSDPPGARIWLNDTEIGRTPASASFKFYGVYDVRLEAPGHEPLHTRRRVEAPLYEYPVIDLVAMAVPGRRRHHVAWHFELEPAIEQDSTAEHLQTELLDRAKRLESQLGPPPERAEPPPENP
ncbi:MAG: PEGA domain-containing protein [Phycisphaeraceae bacterium]|nr:PEGA domain-containing protein [Phycisphaeraceae bacterium]MCW5753655.1 PEGA domain-containing protein [Phycisphaeraceae bacterium]